MKETSPAPLKTLLRNNGYKATPRRLAILELLQKSKKPLSSLEILRGLGRQGIDQATVYRNLAALEKSELVRSVNLQHGHMDYEFAGDDHHHMVCATCGRIEDFGDCGLDALAAKVLRRSSSFSKLNRHSLELFGICKACDKK